MRRSRQREPRTLVVGTADDETDDEVTREAQAHQVAPSEGVDEERAEDSARECDGAKQELVLGGLDDLLVAFRLDDLRDDGARDCKAGQESVRESSLGDTGQGHAQTPLGNVTKS